MDRRGGLSRVWVSCRAALLVLSACSRSGLLVDSSASDGTSAGAPSAGAGAGAQVGVDAPATGGRGAGPMVAVDASTMPDMPDAPDAQADAADGSAPPIPSCDDELGRGIFVVARNGDLHRFDPMTDALQRVGALTCGLGHPFSMAVDRTGLAFVSLDPDDSLLGSSPGELARVDTSDASCEVIEAYEPSQHGLDYFGMAFLGDERGDTLYVAAGVSSSEKPGLATIDLTSFELTLLGAQDPPFSRVELTSGPGGRLFALYAFEAAGGVFIGELDRSNGRVIGDELVPEIEIPTPGTYAFAYWQGDFYLFIGQNGATTITRVRFSDWDRETVAVVPGIEVVGAGRAPCREERRTP